MKKRFCRLILLFVFGGFLYAFETQNIITITLPAQDTTQENTFIKIPALDLEEGDSGIITREINNNQFILFNAEVININDGVALVKLDKFNTMKEKYLPIPKGKVQEGDKAIFRILYDRAVIIAPNQNIYQDIANSYKLDFVHSDIFATFLAKNGKTMPDENDFKNFCEKFDVGLVFIAKETSLQILNCQSFKILEQTPYTPKDNTTKMPFYTRLSDETIQKIFSIKKMSDYYPYFDKLVTLKNTQNPNIQNLK